MPVPDHILRFWRALDALFARVQPTCWGAVVTDARFPAVWDANYARVDAASRDLTAGDIEAALLPALREAGASTLHVVTFHPEETTGMLTELSSRGHRLTWDLVMDLHGDPPGPGDIPVEELRGDAETWERVEASIGLFGVETQEAVTELLRIEREIMAPGGKRWFGVRDDGGTIVSLAALVLLEGVGYVDNVATFPHSRGRGYASAITARIAREARTAGAANVSLLTDPDAAEVVRLYERLGFRRVGRLAATRGPVPDEVAATG